MNRCLSERALLEVSTGEGTAAQHAHLRMCADCAERYDEFTEDLQAIGDVLVQAQPAAPAVNHVPRRLSDLAARSDQRERAIRRTPAAGPIAIAATVLLAMGLMVTLLLARTPLQVTAQSGNVPAFAADVSAALFANTDDATNMHIGSDAPYLQAALEGDLPCTQERFFDGECDDQVLALVLESD